MTLILHCHPAVESKAVQVISVDVGRVCATILEFRFQVNGSLSYLRLPDRSEPLRRDGLWRTTCFEFFFTLPTGYCEYNLSPSTEWNAYRFDIYRGGMRILSEIGAPNLEDDAGAGWYEFEGHLTLPSDVEDVSLRMGVSAVIEEIDGTKSYWALAHAPGPPDFHNPACFTATLPPPAAA